MAKSIRGMYGIDTRLSADWKPKGPQEIKSVTPSGKPKSASPKKFWGAVRNVRKGKKFEMPGKGYRAMDKRCRCEKSKKNGKTYCFKLVNRSNTKNIVACKPGRKGKR